jgi:hypothetical protein
VIVVESHPYPAAILIGGLHLALHPGHVVEAARFQFTSGSTPAGLWCRSCGEPLCVIEEAGP